nr:cuticle protein [synthetic construct]
MESSHDEEGQLQNAGSENEQMQAHGSFKLSTIGLERPPGQVNDNIGVDGYKFGFETSNGISHDEEGQLQNAGSENEQMQAHGSFKFTDPASGKTITVTYTADENGYRPSVSIA